MPPKLSAKVFPGWGIVGTFGRSPIARAIAVAVTSAGEWPMLRRTTRTQPSHLGSIRAIGRSVILISVTSHRGCSDGVMARMLSTAVSVLARADFADVSAALPTLFASANRPRVDHHRKNVNTARFTVPIATARSLNLPHFDWSGLLAAALDTPWGEGAAGSDA